MIFNTFTTDNWISIIGIGLPLFIGLISFIVKAISDSGKRTEELRPNVFIRYERYWKNGIYYQELLLKNYGLTSAIITSVQITPKFEGQGKQDFMPNTFSSIKEFPLATGQEMRTIIGASGQDTDLVKPEKRHYKISYRNQFFKKEYNSEYDIDELNLPTIIYNGNGIEKIEVKIDSKQFNKITKKRKNHPRGV